MNTLNGGGCESESNDKMNFLKFGVCTARQVINSIKLVFVSYQIYDIKMRFRIENHNTNYIKSVFGSKITKLMI